MVLGEGIIQRFLIQSLSAYFENIDRDNLSVAVMKGDITLSNVQMRHSVLDHLGFGSVRLVHGTVGLLRARVPWHRFGAAPVVFELDDMFVLVESSGGISEPKDTISAPSVSFDELRASAEELLAASSVGDDSTTGGPPSPTQKAGGSSWGRWLRRAGNVAKRFIDSIEIQIKIKKVHIRYSGEGFTAGMTLDGLNISTTSQLNAAKILELSNLAVYLSAHEEEPVDDPAAAVVASIASLHEHTSICPYVLEPVSGSIRVSYNAENTLVISGNFPSMVISLSQNQLETGFYLEMKRIMMSTAAKAAKSVIDTAVPEVTKISSPIVSELNTNSPWLQISCCVENLSVRTAGADGLYVEFLAQQISLSGTVSQLSLKSEYGFAMRDLVIRKQCRMGGDLVVLWGDQTKELNVDSTRTPKPFVAVSLIVRESGYSVATPPVEMRIELGSVHVGFYPEVVSQIMVFVKSVGSSSSVDSDMGLESSVEIVQSISSWPKLRLQFSWEAMSVDWYSGSIFLAHSRMRGSVVTVELFSNDKFQANGHLREFSLFHNRGGRDMTPILQAARADTSYLFDFFVESSSSELAMRFNLSAVQVTVVRSVWLRLWDFVFQGFLPGLAGSLGSSPAAEEFVRPYNLSVVLDAVTLDLPLSVLANSNSCSLSLEKLVVWNENQIINFSLSEARMETQGEDLFNGVQIKAGLEKQFINGNRQFHLTTELSASGESPLSIGLSQRQFSYLCDLLNFNILGLASDGLDFAIGTFQIPVVLSVSDFPWLNFSFQFPLLELKMSELDILMQVNNAHMHIAKHASNRLKIGAGVQSLTAVYSNDPLVSLSRVEFSLDSDQAQRNIGVAVSDPSLWVDLGVFMSMKGFFFDQCPTYLRPAIAVAIPIQSVNVETSLSVSSVGVARLVLPSDDAKSSILAVSCKIISYHQTWLLSSLTRKLILNGCTLESARDGTRNGVISNNLNLFVSIDSSTDGVQTSKINCEPVEFRVGFSHIKMMSAAVGLQIRKLGALLDKPGEKRIAQNGGSAASVPLQSTMEIIFHSFSVLLVNDCAVMQNTPLLFLQVREGTAHRQVSVTQGDTEPGDEDDARASSMLRSSLDVLAEVSIKAFNRVAVAWEPLIEGISSVGGNSDFVRVNLKRSEWGFCRQVEEPSSNTSSERSVQTILDFPSELNEFRGVQFNLTPESIENAKKAWKDFTVDQAVGDHATKTSSSTLVHYSPYSVLNLSGVPLTVLGERVAVGGQTIIKQLAVLAEPVGGASASTRPVARIEFDENISDNISASQYCVPRMLLDRPAFHSVQQRDVGQKEHNPLYLVTSVDHRASSGQKIVSIESPVLVQNNAGFAISLKVGNEYVAEIPFEARGGIPFHLGTQKISIEQGVKFRIGMTAGEGSASWSGSVSLGDLWMQAVDDTSPKLWQLSLAGSTDKSLTYLYLTAVKNTVSFRAASVEQLTVTVHPTVSVRSTLPVELRVGIADTDVWSENFLRARVDACTGRAALCNVGLSRGGEVWFHVALKSVRGSVKAWPLDFDSEQDYKILKLSNSSSDCVKIQAILVSKRGEPPTYLLHTPVWLSVVEVPRTVRYACEFLENPDWSLWEDEEASDESDHLALDMVGSTSSESHASTSATYTAPLDFQTSSVCALLHKTRSEPFSIASVGSAGSISMDAADTKGVKLRQEFSVTVGGIGNSNVSTELPVKVVTVAPKFLIVNTLKRAAVCVREVNGTKTVTVEHESQKPFKWWMENRDRESLGKYLQTKLVHDEGSDSSDWSGPFPVHEIGEHLVQGLANVRVEVRMYRGGYYVVFSSILGPSERQSSETRNQASKNHSIYRLLVPRIGLSVVSNKPTRSEILAVVVSNTVASFTQNVFSELELQIEAIQIDDMRDKLNGVKFPVVMKKSLNKRGIDTPPERSVSREALTGPASQPPSSSSSMSPLLRIAAVWRPYVRSDTSLLFESASVALLKTDLCIDYSLVADLTELVIATIADPLSTKASASQLVHNPSGGSQLPLGSLRIWSFKSFSLSPVRLSFSFAPSTDSHSALLSNYSVILKAVACMANVDRSPLKFDPLHLKNFRASRSSLFSVIIEHYKHQLYLETRTLMGSAEALGNPIGLVNAVSVGVQDLFLEPYTAIQNMSGPEELFNVADKTAKGAKSFFKNTAYGVFNSMAQLASTSAQTLSVLTEDHEFIANRNQFHSKNKPAHLGDGMVVGAASFGKGILSGISGLVTKPVQGLEEEGIAGLAKGTVKGVGGFFLKPVAGLFDFAKSAADGIVVSTRDSSMDATPVRLSRTTYGSDRVIKTVNPEHSLIKWYLSQMDGFVPVSSFSYSDHVFDSQNSTLVVLGSTHLIAADTKEKRLVLLVPTWRVLGASPDWNKLILTVLIQMPSDTTGSRSSTPRQFLIDFSAATIMRSVHQMIATALQM